MLRMKEVNNIALFHPNFWRRHRSRSQAVTAVRLLMNFLTSHRALHRPRVLIRLGKDYRQQIPRRSTHSNPFPDSVAGSADDFFGIQKPRNLWTTPDRRLQDPANICGNRPAQLVEDVVQNFPKEPLDNPEIVAA